MVILLFISTVHTIFSCWTYTPCYKFSKSIIYIKFFNFNKAVYFTKTFFVKLIFRVLITLIFLHIISSHSIIIVNAIKKFILFSVIFIFWNFVFIIRIFSSLFIISQGVFSFMFILRSEIIGVFQFIIRISRLIIGFCFSFESYF